MEIFAGTLIIFLVCGACLGIGQLLGRDPIKGGCRPDSHGHCKTTNCSLRCLRRHSRGTNTGAHS